MQKSTVLRSARVTGAAVVLSAFGAGLAASGAHADWINSDSTYHYYALGHDGEADYRVPFGGFERPTAMDGDVDVAYCIEMGPYQPTVDTEVIEQQVTDEYPEIAYAINKYSSDKSDLNQAAVAYLVHTHLDVNDDDYNGPVGPGDSSPEHSYEELLANYESYAVNYPDMKELADSYWREAQENASNTYTAGTLKVENKTQSSATVKGFDIRKDNGDAVAGDTKITVRTTGSAQLPNGEQEQTLTLAEAQEGVALTKAGEGTWTITYEASELPRAELVIAQMGEHPGSEGAPWREGAPTQTSVSALSGTAEIEAKPAAGEFNTPTAGTVALDKSDGDKNLVQAGAIIEDTVEFEFLEPETDYVVEGEIFDKTTGELTDVRASTEFTTDETGSGEVKVTFPKLPEGLAGHELVVYETIKTPEGEVVVEHRNPDDKRQTIYVAEISSEISDDADGDQVVAQKGATATDVFTYTNLTPGKEYRLVADFVDKETGEPVGVNAEVKFTPEETNGTVDVPLEIGNEQAGRTIVVFAELYDADVLTAWDRELENPSETLVVADVQTEAWDKADGDKIIAWRDGTVVDTISYDNFVPGQEYTAEGVLMDKATEEPLKDDEGKDVTATAKFTPEEASGSFDLEFQLPAGAEGKNLVAFETVKDENGDVFAEHRDMNDANQSVDVSQILSEAADKADGDQEMGPDGTIIDTVIYSNLVPGEEYTLKAELVDRETQEPIVDGEGKAITGNATFTPEEANGETEVALTFEGAKPAKGVIFETLTTSDDTVQAEHKDPADEKQFVTINETPPPPVEGAKAKTGGESGTVAPVDVESNRGWIAAGVAALIASVGGAAFALRRKLGASTES